MSAWRSIYRMRSNLCMFYILQKLFLLMPLLCMSALVSTEIKNLTYYKNILGRDNVNYRTPKDFF